MHHLTQEANPNGSYQKASSHEAPRLGALSGAERVGERGGPRWADHRLLLGPDGHPVLGSPLRHARPRGKDLFLSLEVTRRRRGGQGWGREGRKPRLAGETSLFLLRRSSGCPKLSRPGTGHLPQAWPSGNEPGQSLSRPRFLLLKIWL